ncbi:MAG TPA: TonB-dependent receptor [Sphingomicrobium sp.]|nr:TonB-dependent receptor [Sphingomicrobium sp.]
MRKSVWLLSAGIFALSTPAHAQETDTDQNAAQPTEGATAEGAAVDDAAVEQQSSDTSDIVITATRRNEALSDVPLAVSAVTAETLENSGASDIRQIQQVSPSLQVFSTSSEAGASRANIRGIGTVGDNPGLESSVAVFIDGVYRSRTGTALSELGALDRVEVLRGPQGTLFGRNASAGLISIITAKPRFENMIAGEASIGNYDSRRFELSATGPVSESFAIRADAVYFNRDGFLTDVKSGRDVNDRNRVLVRVQGLYQPTDDLSVRVTTDATRRREECCAATYLRAFDYVNTGGTVTQATSQVIGILRGLGAVINDDPFDREMSITPGRSHSADVDDYGISGEVVKDFGNAELTSISAYRFNEYERGQDADFNNLDLWFRDGSGGSANRFRTFTQELRLQGEGLGGRLDWLVGGYFANENLRVLDNIQYGDDYNRWTNCLVASNFAANPLIGPAILAPGASPTCFNTNVASAVRSSLIASLATQTPAQQAATVGSIATLSAFARLNNTGMPLAGVNFTGAAYGPGGFSNLALALGGGSLALNGNRIDDVYKQSSTNWALFTHNIFSFTDNLKLTVGARYTRERKTVDISMSDTLALCSFFAGGALFSLQTLPCVVPSAPGGFSIDDKKSEGKLSGTVVLSYKPFDQLLTYASFSRGYKAGGFNLDRSALRRSNGNGAICTTAAQFGCGGIAASGDDLKFAPEINNAFELGMKYNGVGLDLNVALFHQLFENFQLNTFNGLNFVVENINSCKTDLNNADEDNSAATGACTGDTRAGVRSMGLEVELFTRPLPNVTWNIGGVYADTRYRNNLVGAGGRPLTNALFQLPNRNLSNSAEWTATTSFSWTPPIGGSGMRGLFYIDARHSSEFNSGSDLDLEKIQKGFNVVNGRIGLHGPNQSWGIELWGQNLFDEKFIQVAFDAPPGQGSGTLRGTQQGAVNGFYNRSTQLFGVFLGEPRTYGLTLRGKF